MKMELTENQRAIKKLLDDVGINTDEIELAFTIENLTKKVEVLDNKLDEKITERTQFRMGSFRKMF